MVGLKSLQAESKGEVLVEVGKWVRAKNDTRPEMDKLAAPSFPFHDLVR